MNTLRVLIPLDGSEFSQQILDYVQKFLDPAVHEIIFLRVFTETVRGLVPVPPTAVGPEGRTPYYESARDANLARHPIYASQIRDNVRAELEHEMQPILHAFQAAGYRTSAEILFGDPAEEILQVSKDCHADMIAMTTHGRTGLARLLFGSVAQRVLTKAAVPVLLLRPSPLTSNDKSTTTMPHQISVR
jgi:nucleotide-binding universal stress UspA family protein